ncbi:hypothetical protein BC833DRAFT_400320 [Globomyces pollinis-pini]|nr:hypothetical protein BC833DRAFT_400320 [Globomyces pollinis-pini]
MISLKDKEMVEMRDLVHKEIQESIKNVHMNQITSSRSLFIKNLSKHILPKFPVKLTNRWIELTHNITNHSYDMNENNDLSFHVEKKRRLTLSKLDTSPAIEHSNFYGQDLSPVEIARAAESDPVQSFEVMPWHQPVSVTSGSTTSKNHGRHLLLLRKYPLESHLNHQLDQVK